MRSWLVGAGLVLLGSPLLVGCGSSGSSTRLSPIAAPSPAPANLCATIPAPLREGLETQSTLNPNGIPTASCSLRTLQGQSPGVTVSVNWIQYDGPDQAQVAYQSQCTHVDASILTEVPVDVPGTDESCGAQDVKDPGARSLVNALLGNDLLIARVSTAVTGPARGAAADGSAPAVEPSLSRAQALLQGVASSLTAK